MNVTARKLWFKMKLDIINDEFDTNIGAIVADLILK